MADQDQPTGGGEQAPAPADSGRQPDVTQAAPGEAKPTARKIAPIKDKPGQRPAVPGLIRATDDDGFFGKPEERDAKTGRFVAKIQGKLAEQRTEAPGGDDPDAHAGEPGEVAPPAAPGETGEQPVVEAPKTFTFAGKNYASQAEAEQSFRSLQGMFKPVQETQAELHNTRQERDKAAEVAHAWAKEAKAILEGTIAPDRLKTIKAQLGVGSNARVASQTATGNASGVNIDEFIDPVDMQAFALLAADPEGGLDQAGKFLSGRILATVIEKIVPMIQEQNRQELEPIMIDRAHAEHVRSADAVINQVAALRDQETGEQVFPELLENDGEHLQEIGAFWRQYGGSLEDLVTPRGLMTAVSLWRALIRPARRGVVARTVAAAGLPTPRAGAAASVDGGPSGGGATVTPRLTGVAAQRAALKRELSNTQLTDPKLGFRRNRPSAEI